MLKYILPLYYTIHSRSKGIHFVSYFLMVFMPPFLLKLFLTASFSLIDVFLYLLSFLGMLSVYECGYLINDVVCIKKDPQPTNRISEEEREKIERRLPFIILCKLFVCIFFSILLSNFNSSNIFFYGICNILIFVGYVVHNHYRNWISFVTVFILTTLNYFTPLAFFTDYNDCSFYLFFIILYFSIPKTYFYIVRKVTKHSIKNEPLKFGIYYIVAAFITLILFLMNNVSFYTISIPLYLSLYRFSIFIGKKII